MTKTDQSVTTNSEKVNDDRNDPYPTPKLDENPVEPKIDENTKDIGGYRKSKDVQDKRELPQAGLQKTLLDANIDRKENQSPLKEKEDYSMHDKPKWNFPNEEKQNNESYYKPYQSPKDHPSTNNNGASPTLPPNMPQKPVIIPQKPVIIPQQPGTTITQKQLPPNKFNNKINQKEITLRRGNTSVTISGN